MNGLPALCIVVRDDMLSAALASKKIRRLFDPQETQSFGQKGTMTETPSRLVPFRL